MQGVGFRWTTTQYANELGLKGWVKNLEDGRVEMVASGREDCLTDLLRKLEARFTVTKVEKEVLQEVEDFVEFLIER